MSGRERILVIKFSALGDFVQAFAAFPVIRSAHPTAEITLLTTPPYADLARDSGLFDTIETDGKPRGLWAMLRLIRRLRRARFTRVYDLQTSRRSKRYFQLFWPHPPLWSGISPGAAFRQTRPDRETMHNLDRLADQLHVAGISPAYPIGLAPLPQLDWALRRDAASAAERLGVTAPFALLIPGASAHRPAKFWPIDHYQTLARMLSARGLSIVVVGSAQEAHLGGAIADAAGALDLTGKTRMSDLAGLGAEAALCVTNDTGPGHMAAYAGAPGVMLMSAESSPSHYAPRGQMKTIQVDDLKHLSAEAVMTLLVDLIPAQAG